MDNFDYKKYIKEGKLLNEFEDMRPKDIEFEKAKEEERLANHPEEETIRKIQAMFADEKSLEEDEEGKDLNKKELKDLLNKAEDMFYNTNWKRVELAKLFSNLNKQDREKLAIDSQVPILKDILRNESVEKPLEEDDNKIKDLESQLDFHTQMDNMGRASIIKDKIEKLRKLSNSGEIDGDEFLDKFNPLSKELKSLDESKISSYEKQLKIAYDALEKAEKDGDIRGGELALAAIDSINGEIDSYFRSKLSEQLETNVVNTAKLALKSMPMSDVYIKSLESDVEKNGEGGYVDFRKDDWVEDYSEFIVDKLDS